MQGLTNSFDLIDISELIYSQCQQFHNLVAQKNLSFNCEPDADLPLVEAEPERVAQILGNLIHNAYKYTPTGGSMSVKAHAVEEEDEQPLVVIEVTDTGPGIPPGEHDRIFQSFYRGPEHKRIHQGMGIGLALARQLAEAHGGALTVDDQQEKGARFILRLPVHHTELRQPTDP